VNRPAHVGNYLTAGCGGGRIPVYGLREYEENGVFPKLQALSLHGGESGYAPRERLFQAAIFLQDEARTATGPDELVSYANV
jgi:hypothetical protein